MAENCFGDGQSEYEQTSTLHKTFKPAEASCLAQRLKVPYT